MGETSPWSCTEWSEREREGEERIEEGRSISGGVTGVDWSTWVASYLQSKI